MSLNKIKAIASLMLITSLVSGCGGDIVGSFIGDLSNDNNSTGISTSAITITLSKTELVLEVGDSDALIPVIVGSNKTVTWSSSAPAIASVSNGVVTAHSMGTAVIKATIDDSEASCNVTVAEAGINEAKSAALDIIEKILDNSIAINEDGVAKFAYSEFYSNVNWQLFLTTINNAKEAITLATTIVEVNQVLANVRATSGDNPLTLLNIARLSIDDYKDLAYISIDDFIGRLDTDLYFDFIWEGILSFFDEIKFEISELNSEVATHEEIKAIKDNACERIINEALTKIRFITWWEIDVDYTVEDLMNDLRAGVSTGLDAAIVYFLTIPAKLLLEGDALLLEVFEAEFLDLYGAEFEAALDYFIAMDEEVIKDYLVGSIIEEMIFLMDVPGLLPEPGANTNDIKTMFSAERELVSIHEDEFSAPVYDAEALLKFDSIVAQLDCSQLISTLENNLSNFLATLTILMDEFIIDFWQIDWASDEHFDITFDLKGGTLNDEEGPIVIDFRYRDLDIGLKGVDPEYRGPYFIPDDYFTGWEMFWEVFESKPVKGEIEFLNWVDKEGRALQMDNYFGYVYRNNNDGEVRRNLQAMWNEEAQGLPVDSPLIGVWSLGDNNFYLEIFADGSYKYLTFYSGILEEAVHEEHGAGYQLKYVEFGGGTNGFIKYVEEDDTLLLVNASGSMVGVRNDS